MTHFQRKAYSLNGNVATIKRTRPRLSVESSTPPRTTQSSPPVSSPAAISTSGGVDRHLRGLPVSKSAAGQTNCETARGLAAMQAPCNGAGSQSGPLTNPFGLPYVQPQRSFLPRREPIFSSPPRIFVGMFWGLVLSAPIYAFILWMLFR